MIAPHVKPILKGSSPIKKVEKVQKIFKTGI
jgi:hypothetical protein